MPLTAERRYAYGGGLNTSDNPTSLRDDELSDVRNFGYDLTGALVARNGQARISTTPADSNKVTSLTRYYLRSGSSFTVFFRNQTMYRQTGVDGTSIDATAFTANTTFSYATFNNILYYTNGTDTTSSQTMRKWTGTGSASAPSGSPATACKYLLASTKMQRLIATGDGTDIVYGSALGDGEDWTTSNNAFSINVRTFKGDITVGAVEISAGILIFKNSSVHLMTGSDPQTVSVVPISLEVGCSSPRSIAANQRSAFWVYNGRVYECDGTRVFPISNKITPTLAAMVSPTVWIGVVYKDQYRLHVASTGSTNNRVLVYYFNQPTSDNRRPWSQFDSTTVSAATVLHGSGDTGQLYTGDYSGYINQQDSGTTDLGSAITSYATTGWQFLKEPERRKKFKRLWVVTKPIGAYTLRVYSSWDGVDNSTTYDSISLATSTPSLDIDFQLDVSGLDGGSADFITQDVQPINTAKSIKIKFYCTGQAYIYGHTIIERRKRVK